MKKLPLNILKKHEKIRQKKYYLEHKKEMLKKRREYGRKNNRGKYLKSLGSRLCPICSKIGYFQLYYILNLKTKHESATYTLVKHQHTEKKKTVYEGCCYIGKEKIRLEGGDL